MSRHGRKRHPPAARARLVAPRTEPIGGAPGVLPAGPPPAQRAQLDAFVFAPDRCDETAALRTDDACALVSAEGTTWINLAGVDDTATVAAVGQAFGLHPLAVEDIVHLQQRSKVEVFGDQVFVVAQMVSPLPDGTWETEQVSFVLGDGFLLTFQEDETDVFGPVRARLRTSGGRVRARGADYLLYALLDLLVDSLFTVLEGVGDRTEALEDAAVRSPAPRVQVQIMQLRRDVALLRRSVWPMREVIAGLQRDTVPHVTDDTLPYLRDVYDHLVQAIDVLESLRDVLAALLDLYLSAVSTRQNEVMKVLTVVGAIFLPLTFLTGLYGMNFDVMPELHTRSGYYVLLGVMALLTVGTLAYFRHRRWI